MKKRNLIFIISLLVLFLGGGGIIFFLVQKQKTQTAENSAVSSSTKNDNPNSSDPKKILANQIKADLEKDLEKAKKEGMNNLTYVNSPWGGCGVPSGEEGYIVLVSPNTPENKGKRDSIAPSELEKEDYEEIVELIKQTQTTAEKVTQQKRQEQEAKLNQKLSGNSKMFFYEGEWEWKDYDDIRHVFRGVESGQKYYLVFSKNHSATTNLPKSYNPLQQNGFYLIEGVENIPFQPEKKRYASWKEINLSDKITIVLSNS